MTLMLLASASLSLNPSFGQATSTGTVVGTIADQTGAVIAGATVTIKDASTGSTRTTTTNSSGQYVMVNIPPGDYTIRVSKTGFSVSEIMHQAVSVGSQTTADVKLMLGATQTVVEVQAATGADLQTLNATIGSTVGSTAIDALPALRGDVSTFATLQPGVTPDGSVGGTQVDQVTMQLDGGNNSSDMDGSMTVYTGAFGGNPTGINAIGGGASGVMPMPADSVEEFKVNTANQTADFNNSSGAQVEVVTKRGHNRVHGTVYEYYLDSNIGANTWDNNLTSTAKPSYHYNRFGAALGGPVLPTLLGGKTYLFGNYEGFRYPNSATFERSVPSAALRAGIATFKNSAGTAIQYNLKTLDPRGIGIDPTVSAFWNQYEPVGNDPKCTLISGTRCDQLNEIGYKANVNLPQKSDFGVARLDHDFGAKWHFTASYRYFKFTTLNTSQVDIGGYFAGDTLGKPVSVSSRPQDRGTSSLDSPPTSPQPSPTTSTTATFATSGHGPIKARRLSAVWVEHLSHSVNPIPARWCRPTSIPRTFAPASGTVTTTSFATT
jgi:Carboxypeptidase regulatory-like domain